VGDAGAAQPPDLGPQGGQQLVVDLLARQAV